MAKNIEMNYKGESAYEIIYPNIIAKNIVSFEGENPILTLDVANLYGLDETGVPNDIFYILAQLADRNGFRIKVQLTDGTPVVGATITGITAKDGGAVITDDNGLGFGFSESNSVTIQAISPYYDWNNSQSQQCTVSGFIGSCVLTLQNKQLSDNIVFTSSSTVKFSPLYGNIDIFLVGGGGSGGIGMYGQYGGSTGGGGGYTQTIKNINVQNKELQIVVGSAGSAVSQLNHSQSGIKQGLSGGETKIQVSGGSDVYSAQGGKGGRCIMQFTDGDYGTITVPPATGGANSAGVTVSYNTSGSYSGSASYTNAQNGKQAFDESTGDVYGSGGGAYGYNPYGNITPGVAGGIGAGGYTLTTSGKPGTNYGAGGGPGCADNYMSYGNATCTSGAGKQGIVIIRKSII